MKIKNAQNDSNDRLSTGIRGLDDLLCGGFRKGSAYLILGPPGSGKTIFANQICFHQVKQGSNALYVTLLAESHAGMFSNLSSMKYFDKSQISKNVQYINGYSVLEKEGLDGLMRLLREMIGQYEASVLFIDGVASADELSGTKENFKRFVHNINSVIGMTGCTTFLLSSSSGEVSNPEHTMVDGIISMGFFQKEMKTVREIEVTKFRGSPHLHGRHFYTITEKGMEIYPRIEELYGHEVRYEANLNSRLKFGIEDLDEMLDGGVVEASTTSLVGPVGAGKSVFGMSFLVAGAKIREKGLMLSFYEPPDRLISKMEKLDLPVSKLIKSGNLKIDWRNREHYIIDKIFAETIITIQEHQIKRLFVDGLGIFKVSMLRPERLAHVLSAFVLELKALGVTTVVTEEFDIPEQDQGQMSYRSDFTDNILKFDLVALSGEMIHSLSVQKTRETPHDKSLREICFVKDRISLGRKLKYKVTNIPEVEVVNESTGKTRSGKR